LFGLDKLADVDRTVAHLAGALQKIAALGKSAPAPAAATV
jgi:hypothetical protein